MATHSHEPASDKGAAYVGLFSGAIFLFIVVFSIVKWTNGHYASEGAEKPAAAAATP